MKKKKGIGKRGLLLGLLVVVLGVAVYGNFVLSESAPDSTVTDVAGGTSAMGQAVYVNGGASSVTDQNDYFEQTKTQRQTARDASQQALEEIIENPKSDSAGVADATSQLTQIARDIETEANMESLLKAKGFAQCVVIVEGETVSVVVQTNGLLPSDTAQIQEIAETSGGFSLENIKIIEVK